MIAIESGPDETLEDLQLKGYRLLQKKTGFRYGMDSVLLAHFASIAPQGTVVDFGTGSGILPLLLYGRNKGSCFYGLELVPELAEMAQRTMTLNGLQDVIHILCADAGKANLYFDKCSVDAVVCNPPYFLENESVHSPDQKKEIARTTCPEILRDFCKAAFSILKGKGKLFIVYPAVKMLEIMKLLQAHHLEPKRFQMVYSSVSKPAHLVLIEAVKDAKPTLHPMHPLIIFDEHNHLTNELKSVYHISCKEDGTA